MRGEAKSIVDWCESVNVLQYRHFVGMMLAVFISVIVSEVKDRRTITLRVLLFNEIALVGLRDHF